MMPKTNYLSPLLLVGFVQFQCWSFTSPLLVSKPSAFAHDLWELNAKGFAKSSSDEGKQPVRGAEAAASLSPEHVFQSLMRDLQIEGVPLLECDAASVETYQAAVWTTMAEMSDSDKASKNCLVFEKIPMSALIAFADDVATLKLQPRMMNYLPELERFSVQVVGKGAGPALVFDATERTAEEIIERETRTFSEASITEKSATSALKSFVDRVVIAEAACPYTKNADSAPVGLESKGVNPASVGYRYGGSSDAAHALASFWTCICELQSLPESDLSTVVLSLPCIGPGKSDEALNRFATVVELISRILCMFRGDAMFGLVHFHPAYNRDAIFPNDKPAYGHLPPRAWLRPMLRMNNNESAATSLTDDQLALSDYQRRSPHTAINILRTTQIAAAAGAKSIVDLQLDDSSTVKASGILTYSRNAIRLAEIGKGTLDEALDQEMEMARSA
jgi:hypothetical protein